VHLAIIGNGVSGVSAALEVRRLRPDWRITLISGESTHHYSRPALMYLFMGHMRYAETKPFEDRFWEEQRLDLLRAWVTHIDVEEKRLELHGGSSLEFDKLLVATGSKPNRFGWPGQDLEGVQGLWGLLDLRELYENARETRAAVVVGGGLIGIELGEMLHSRGIAVTFLVRERSYWSNVLPAEESAMINREIRAHGMELLLETELERIVDRGDGRCGAVETKDGRRIDCQLVGLTAGVRPNFDVLEGSGIETGRGVLVDGRLRTSAADVYAAGDCAEIRTGGERKLVQQVWYTGKMQGRHVARTIAGEDPGDYEPGIWFNSAKFLDLEYQTYGQVNRDVPGERSLYWEHPEGRHAVRIVYTDDGVVGFNTIGVRWRHEVCERWLAERAPVREVVQGLEAPWFEPELFRRHEPAMRRAFLAAL